MSTTYGFELVQERGLPELNSQAQLYRHLKTGAEVLSLSNDDENKVFGITFRTPPSDSTGLPHILEHSVLCGSRKYPSKEPFVELLKGSLKTFLNAMTYPDKTVYPVASQNLQDFYNLVDVYLDAVLYPRITPQTLQQEGWHYELEDKNAPLVYKGVVFNEMKGANSSPERRLNMATQNSLFPDNVYGVDSGGDPAVIPDLTYSQFKRFHESYYHPSNARAYFYGDDDPTERLRILDQYFSEFEGQEVDSTIPLQPRFAEPMRLTRPYPVGAEEASEKKAMVVVSWMLGENNDPLMALALRVLDYILLGTPGSPLRKALIDSGLGEDTANHGLDTEYRQVVFSTGLKGASADDAERIEALILDTLTQLADDGIDPDAIDAAINSMEFSLRENNTGSYPRGLAWMLHALSTWLHDGDPMDYLAFETPLQTVKAHVATGEPIFEGLIRECFLNNPHRTTLTLKPDSTLAKQIEDKEDARLKAARAGMSDADLEQIIADTKALKLAQETPDSPEDLALIPCLGLEDLEREGRNIPIDVSQYEGTQILYHDLFTNGIAYLDLGMDLRLLSQELLPYVPIFGSALLEMGTEREDFVKLSQRIDRDTGGIHTSTWSNVVRGSRESVAKLFLRGKAMVSRVDALFAILQDVLLTVQLDNQERFLQMVLEHKAGLESSVMPMGHAYINRRMRAHFSAADWANEQMRGISQLFFLRQLAEDVQSDWPRVHAILEQIRSTLLNRQALLCNVTLDQESWQRVEPQLQAFLNQLPNASVQPTRWTPTHSAWREGLTIPARVNYVGKANNLYRLGYEFDGSARLISRFLGTSWMWEKVRVQGGAYGGFATFDSLSGTFSFLSYRDPNLLDTLSVYDRSADFLRTVEITEDELTKSIIGTIGALDAYQLPDAKGYTSMERHLTGTTDKERQQRREEVLTTTVSDFRAFGELLAQASQDGAMAILGSQEGLERANEELEAKLEMTKVL